MPASPSPAADLFRSHLAAHVIAPLHSVVNQQPLLDHGSEDEEADEEAGEEGEEGEGGAVADLPPAVREWLLSSFTSALLLLSTRLQRLHSLTLTLLDICDSTTASSLSARFYSAFHCLLSSHPDLSTSFPPLLLRFFSLHLHTFHRLHSVDPPSPSDRVDHGAFVHLCQQLHCVELLSPTYPTCSTLLSSLFVPFIRARIRRTCEEQTTSHLPSLLAFVRAVVVPFAHLPLPSSPLPSLSTFLLSTTSHLYTLHLISRLFDLLVAFPCSTPLLSDLHSALPSTALQPHLLSSLTSALHRRLLHPGCVSLSQMS